MDEISGIKTLPVYYQQFKYENYEVRQIDLPDSDKDRRENSSSQKSDSYKARSTYVLGVGRSGNEYDENRIPLSYEYFTEDLKRVNDAAFLQTVLNLSSKISSEYSLNNPKSETEEILKFTYKYGLNNLSHDIISVSNSCGYNLCEFYRSVERIRTLYDCFEKIKMEHCTENKNDFIFKIALNGIVNLHIMEFYREAKNELKSILVADSLLDAAHYQLCEIMNNSESIKKCANPSCGNYIIGGRFDQKTCCAACRQAYHRFQRNSAKAQNGGGDNVQ